MVTGFALGVRFLLGLTMLAAYVYIGTTVAGGAVGVVVGLLLAGVVAGIWGAFVAPKASRRLAPGRRVPLELVLFGIAAGGLIANGLVISGATLAIVYVLDIAVLLRGETGMAH